MFAYHETVQCTWMSDALEFVYALVSYQTSCRLARIPLLYIPDDSYMFTGLKHCKGNYCDQRKSWSPCSRSVPL